MITRKYLWIIGVINTDIDKCMTFQQLTLAVSSLLYPLSHILVRPVVLPELPDQSPWMVFRSSIHLPLCSWINFSKSQLYVPSLLKTVAAFPLLSAHSLHQSVCIPRSTLVWSSTFPAVFYPLTSLLSRALYFISNEHLTPCLLPPALYLCLYVFYSPLQTNSLSSSTYSDPALSFWAEVKWSLFLFYSSSYDMFLPKVFSLLIEYTCACIRKLHLSYTHLVNYFIETFKNMLIFFEIWNVYIICTWICICVFTHMYIHI